MAFGCEDCRLAQSMGFICRGFDHNPASGFGAGASRIGINSEQIELHRAPARRVFRHQIQQRMRTISAVGMQLNIRAVMDDDRKSSLSRCTETSKHVLMKAAIARTSRTSRFTPTPVRPRPKSGALIVSKSSICFILIFVSAQKPTRLPRPEQRVSTVHGK